MIHLIKQWYAPPIFPDEDQTRRARLVNILLSTFITLMPFTVIAAVIGQDTPTISLIVTTLVWVILVWLRSQMRRGHLAVAGYGLLLGMMLLVTAILVLRGTIRAPVIAAYLLLVVTAGLLLDRRAVIITTVSVAVLVLVLILAERAGMLPPPLLGPVTITQWVTFIVPLVATAVFIDQAVQSTNKALARARGERDFSDHVINSLPGIFYMFDLHGKLLRWNRNLEIVVGHSGEELTQVRPLNLIIAEERDQMRKNFARAVAMGQLSCEVHLIDRNGQAILYLLSGELIQAESELCLIGTGIEIGQLKQAEAEIRKLNAELEQRVAERTNQLEAANKELEAFAYSVSHDLRAPLRAVDGYSHLLMMDYGADLPAEAQTLLQNLRQGAARMNALINDLLRFSRLGRQPLELRKVSMQQLARQTLDALLAQEPERQVQAVIDDLPDAVADPALIQQVFANLLENAFKYSRSRADAHIQVGSFVQEDQTVYFVRDNGVGFDMRYVDRLFGVFQRLHLAEQFEGTGIGLANVKRIIERHGGKVWAEAELEKGATFYFTLPG
jgi:PAS domain S-box-containing protein